MLSKLLDDKAFMNIVLPLAGALALLAAFALFLIGPANAQHNHSAGHDDYLGWASGKTPACCSNQDCGFLDEGEWRDTSKGTEVKIDGQWCPVEKQHYIIKGKSPDWSRAHACISKYYTGCDKLLCFSRPGGV